jgi:hypothetical protein
MFRNLFRKGKEHIKQMARTERANNDMIETYGNRNGLPKSNGLPASKAQ